MKNSVKKIFYSLIISLFFALQVGMAIPARAQTPAPTTTPSIGGDLVPCAGPECQWCDVFSLLQRVFNTAAFLLFFLIVIYILYGGILYVIGALAGSDSQTKRAKDIVSDAIAGLIISLLTFVIINAAIVGLTGSRIENFLDIPCDNAKFPQPPTS